MPSCKICGKEINEKALECPNPKCKTYDPLGIIAKDKSNWITLMTKGADEFKQRFKRKSLFKQK